MATRRPLSSIGTQENPIEYSGLERVHRTVGYALVEEAIQNVTGQSQQTMPRGHPQTSKSERSARFASLPRRLHWPATGICEDRGACLVCLTSPHYRRVESALPVFLSLCLSDRVVSRRRNSHPTQQREDPHSCCLYRRGGPGTASCATPLRHTQRSRTVPNFCEWGSMKVASRSIRFAEGSIFPRLLFLILVQACLASAQAPQPPNLVLHGKVQPGSEPDLHRSSICCSTANASHSVSFHNLGHDQHTVIDLGIADPVRFRGASGGNKDHFTISETDATPSYLPGAIPPGRWKLLFSIPNIRPGVVSSWTAEIWFNRAIDDSSFTEQPLRDTPHGIAVICTRTPRTVMEAAVVNRESLFLALSSSPLKLQHAAALTSSPLATTTLPPTTTPSGNCNPTSTNYSSFLHAN